MYWKYPEYKKYINGKTFDLELWLDDYGDMSIVDRIDNIRMDEARALYKFLKTNISGQ